jgi:DNA-binding response OmpR family regulator
MKKILVIEGHTDIRNLIQRTLALLHYQVLEASSGVSGALMAQASKPDLVLLDVATPGALNGLEVCRLLKARSPSLRLLLLCPLGYEDALDAGMQAGADGYLWKPFNPAQLLEAIDQLLNAEFV